MTERLVTNVAPNFAEEIAQVKLGKRTSENNWYLMPGTGFNVQSQIDQFERDFVVSRIKGKSTETCVEENFVKIEQDIQAFKIEYLCEGLLFPIVTDIGEVDGQKRLICPLYNNKPLTETVSNQERRGAVKKSILDIENFLLTAEPGSTAVMSSPDGWSGFEGIAYQDTQTFVLHIEESGKPQGFTVKTDMSLNQNYELLKLLGKDISPTGSLQDQIVDVVANPVFLSHKEGQREWVIKDIVDIIQSIKNSPFAYKNKTFSEIYENLDHPESLWTLDGTIKLLTDQLKAYFIETVANGEYDRNDLEIALGVTILKLAHKIRRPKPDTTHFQIPIDPITTPVPFDAINFKAILIDVQSLPGCNGGGGTTQIFTGTITPRSSIETSSLPAAEKTLSCKCPFCNQKVEAIIANNKITCPECDKSVPYEC